MAWRRFSGAPEIKAMLYLYPPHLLNIYPNNNKAVQGLKFPCDIKMCNSTIHHLDSNFIKSQCTQKNSTHISSVKNNSNRNFSCIHHTINFLLLKLVKDSLSFTKRSFITVTVQVYPRIIVTDRSLRKQKLA